MKNTMFDDLDEKPDTEVAHQYVERLLPFLQLGCPDDDLLQAIQENRVDPERLQAVIDKAIAEDQTPTRETTILAASAALAAINSKFDQVKEFAHACVGAARKDWPAAKSARLARIALDDTDLVKMQRDMNKVLHWIEKLNEVDITGVEPFSWDIPLPQRDDVVNDGGYPEQVLGNAPERIGDFYSVPKVVE